MYQRAVWIADDDPNQAWLWLVGAIEVAAEQWRRKALTSSETLRGARPELSSLLLVHGEQHHDEVAALLSQTIRATRRFIDFVL
jgi:hypothetical protein